MKSPFWQVMMILLQLVLGVIGIAINALTIHLIVWRSLPQVSFPTLILKSIFFFFKFLLAVWIALKICVCLLTSICDLFFLTLQIGKPLEGAFS